MAHNQSRSAVDNAWIIVLQHHQPAGPGHQSATASMLEMLSYSLGARIEANL